MTTRAARPNWATAIVVGLGNIGSHLVSHLGRMPAIGRLVLIDPDSYDASNRSGQAITAAAVGQIKVEVQRAVVREINPELAVDARHAPVEEIPLGHLRGDVMLSCLDSRAARQYVNEVARLLGVPWVDAGVEPDSWLARINMYAPEADAACLECAWDQRDYELLPQSYPCQAHDATPGTRAASSLGALAASLQAIECLKLLTGRPAKAAVGRQVLVDAKTHVLFRSTLPRNERCRLPHLPPIEVRDIEARVDELTVSETCALAVPSSNRAPLQLGVPMRSWVQRQVCRACGDVASIPTLRGRTPAPRSCPRCDGRLEVSGFDQQEELSSDDLGSVAQRTLAELGLRNGELIGIKQSDEVRYVAVSAPGDRASARDVRRHS